MDATDTREAGQGTVMDEEKLRMVIAEHGLSEATRRVKSVVEAAAERLAVDRDKLKCAS